MKKCIKIREVKKQEEKSKKQYGIFIIIIGSGCVSKIKDGYVQEK
ncbi:MAG: hypothetical protein ACI4D4_01720 [Lachnospira sp.]